MIQSFFTQLDPLLALQQQLAKLEDSVRPSFWDINLTGPNLYPPVNIFEKEGNLVLVAELPGVKKEDLEIIIENDTLRLSGKRTIYYEDQKGIHRLERAEGQFDRTFHLPFRVDADKTEASYQDGLLMLVLHRNEQDKPKKVAIQ